jgi:hypothetical protein
VGVGGRRQKRLVHATFCLLVLAALWGPISSAAATPLSDQAVSQLQYWNSHPGSVCKAMTGEAVVSVYGEGELGASLREAPLRADASLTRDRRP